MSYVLSFRKPKITSVEDLLKYYKPFPPLSAICELVERYPGIKWNKHIPTEYRPIKYLEIGVSEGDNIIQVANSYCKNPDSKIYCIDPWQDYDEYPEYKGQQSVKYDIAMNNISPYADKCIIHRGFSEDIVPTFPDNYFDIMYVDGNHETDYVYRDGCMSFQKLKKGGYMIFDDYSIEWPQTISGINKFIFEYLDRIRILAYTQVFCQVIIQKIGGSGD